MYNSQDNWALQDQTKPHFFAHFIQSETTFAHESRYFFFSFLGNLFCQMEFMQAIVKYCGGKCILKV